MLDHNTPSFPEVIYSFYALNRLGAVSDYFDPRVDSQVIYNELVLTKTKALIIYEDFIGKFEEIITKANIPLVIVVSPKDSIPVALKFLMCIKGKKDIPSKWITYKEFIKKNQKEHFEFELENVAKLPALIEHTGGTTGVPKAVVLTNLNVNAVMWQYRRLPITYSRNDRFLTVAFPFTAYSMIAELHDPLVLGLQCFLCYDLDIEKVENKLLRNRINQMANTPLVWETVIRSPKAQKTDFSFIVLPTVGADSLAPEKEQEINRFLQEHNCKYKIAKGYGMTEVASAVAITPNNECNKIGSVGIPFVNTVISIFDPDTGKELSYGEQGEICISGPSVMVGYFGDQKATDEILRVHEDGLIWAHSGDYGHMDEDGFLFIDGRIKRMLIDYVGFKIFAPTVEAVLSKCPVVDKCCVVGAPDTVHGVGQIAVAFVILKEPNPEAEEIMRKHCEENLPSYQVPAKYVVTDKFPYTSAAKVDYRALEVLAGESGKRIADKY